MSVKKKQFYYKVYRWIKMFDNFYLPMIYCSPKKSLILLISKSA